MPAAERFIIIDAVFQKYQDRFVQAVQALKVGDPMDPSTQIGPLARGEFIDDLEGYYFEPTVLTGVKPDMPAACEEVFGPVAAMIRARDTDEAVQLTADS